MWPGSSVRGDAQRPSPYGWSESTLVVANDQTYTGKDDLAGLGVGGDEIRKKEDGN